MKNQGFTLIELLITVAIMSILAAIIIPSYRSYIISANLTDGFNNLSAYRLRMEQNYADTGNYDCAAIQASSSTYFTYACQLTNSGQGYLITATGNAINSLNGYAFTINEAGEQATIAFPGAAVPRACWMMKTGDC